MNGRIYDPLLGRMLSADVLVQFPGNLQSYNRYSYVQNNPLSFTDPSGFTAATLNGLNSVPAGATTGTLLALKGEIAASAPVALPLVGFVGGGALISKHGEFGGVFNGYGFAANQGTISLRIILFYHPEATSVSLTTTTSTSGTATGNDAADTTTTQAVAQAGGGLPAVQAVAEVDATTPAPEQTGHVDCQKPVTVPAGTNSGTGSSGTESAGQGEQSRTQGESVGESKAEEKREPAPEATVKKMARQIEKDLGKEARKEFHDAKDPATGDRTLEEARQDAEDLYNEQDQVPPPWMRTR